MNAPLLKSLLVLVPTLGLVVASVVLFKRAPSMGSACNSWVRGASWWVVLTHVFEALDVFP
jgi:hypothetical protein